MLLVADLPEGATLEGRVHGNGQLGPAVPPGARSGGSRQFQAAWFAALEPFDPNRAVARRPANGPIALAKDRPGRPAHEVVLVGAEEVIGAAIDRSATPGVLSEQRSLATTSAVESVQSTARSYCFIAGRARPRPRRIGSREGWGRKFPHR